MPIIIGFFHGNGLIIFPLFLMEKFCLVYVLFGISARIWNGLRTYTEAPLYCDHGKADLVISKKYEEYS
jgi:hypothetical protein